LGIPNDKRLEWERLLTANPVERGELPTELQQLLLKVQEAIGGERGNDSAEPAQCSMDSVLPSAGPHARPELTNPDLTPGTGMLPDPESHDPTMQPTS